MPTRIVQSKHPASSKTLWFNVLSLAVSTAVFLADQQLILDNPQVVYWLGVFVMIGNTVLRFVSTQPLEVSK